MGKPDSKKGTGLKLMKSETMHRMSKDDSAIVTAKVPSHKQPEAQRRRSSSFGGSSSRKSKDSYWKKPQHHVWKANNVQVAAPKKKKISNPPPPPAKITKAKTESNVMKKIKTGSDVKKIKSKVKSPKGSFLQSSKTSMANG